MANWLRAYQFSAGQAGASGFAISELHIQFSVEKADVSSPNTAKIALWNLSPEHKAALEQKDCHHNKHDVQKKRSGTDKIDQKSLNFFQQLFCTPSIRTPEPFVQQQKQRIKNKCNNDGVNCFR